MTKTYILSYRPTGSIETKFRRFHNLADFISASCRLRRANPNFKFTHRRVVA